MIALRKFRQCSRAVIIPRNIIMAESSFHTTSDSKAEFRDLLHKAKNVVVLTGAGASAESGIPTFRGSGGLWRTFRAQDLATLEAFHRNPSLVWEFYSYRREVVLTKEPNNAHYAIAEFQKKLRNEGKSVTVITQNIDELHQRAGTEDVIELHGECYFSWLGLILIIMFYLIIKITISLLVIGLTKSHFPLIRLPSCYRTVCYWIVCYWTVCYRTVR